MSFPQPNEFEKYSATKLFRQLIGEDGNGDLTLRIQGDVITESEVVTTSTVTSVNDNTSSVTLLAANSNRLMAIFTNDSTATAYIKLGATASLTSFSIKLAPSGYVELPFPMYLGQIDAIWDADTVSGAMRITELT